LAPPKLLHLTDSLENIESILEWGLLFTYNPTEILEQILGMPFAHVVAPAPGGMVCFTDLSYKEAKNVFKFRNYGIAVDGKWAKDIGAQPVEYLNPTQEADLLGYRDTLLERLANGFPNETSSSEHLKRWLIELAATKPEFAKSFGLDEEFLSLQTRALWMQTIGHKEEQEWRLRSPQSYPNIEVIPERKNQVELLLRMLTKIPSTRQSLAIKIPQEVVVGIFVPAGRADAAKGVAKRFGYSETCVNPQ
jgi:hypothetical protein